MHRSKWEKALYEGKVWRAKEILRSYIKDIYDPDIYKAYGKILYSLQDYEEAGKYLFMAGEDHKGKYADAIVLFLKRHERADMQQFLSNFPKRFIKESIKNYPVNVQNYLNGRGYTKELTEIQKRIKEDYEANPMSEKVFIVLMAFFLLSFIVGVVTILGWIIDLFQ